MCSLEIFENRHIKFMITHIILHSREIHKIGGKGLISEEGLMSDVGRLHSLFGTIRIGSGKSPSSRVLMGTRTGVASVGERLRSLLPTGRW